MSKLNKRRVVKLFLSVQTVPHRNRDYKQGLEAHERPLRYRATWVVRGTGGDLYKSKMCATQEEAVKLARKHLERLNSPAGYPVHMVDTRTQYVDTTEQPERYGYSHAAEASS